MMRLRMIFFGIILALFLAIGTTVVKAAGHNLTSIGTVVTINGAEYEVLGPGDLTGSGIFNLFVRLSSSESVIRGYNTDFRPPQFNEHTSSLFTRSRLLSEVPQVFVDGSLWREFQLDINQDKSVEEEDYLHLITLDTVEIYESPYNNLCGYPFDGSGGGHSGCTSNNTATLVYDLDAGENSFLILDFRNNEGDGKRDLLVRFPDFLFNQNPNCSFRGEGCTTYITIYSKFGGDSDPANPDPILQEAHGNNDGPEEWGVRSLPDPLYIFLPLIIR